VIGMTVRIQDLDDAELVLFGRGDHIPLAHRRIDHQRVTPLVVNDVGSVVVWRNAPLENAHSLSLSSVGLSPGTDRGRKDQSGRGGHEPGRRFVGARALRAAVLGPGTQWSV